jgi:hypothetical protein
MRIKSRTNCYTTDPNIKWSAGEVCEVEDTIAEKLLKSNNFIRDNSSEYKTREMRADKVSKK